jgi:hypothetical protein
MIRIEAYAVLDGLVLHVAASNLRDTPPLAGNNGMSVHRVIPTGDLEEHGVEEALFKELTSIFQLYSGLSHYALR